MRTVGAILVIASGLTVGGVAHAEPHTPVPICHNVMPGKGNTGNGYNYIVVDDDGTYEGHIHHPGDIIPAPNRECRTGETTTTTTTEVTTSTTSTTTSDPTTTSTNVSSTSTKPTDPSTTTSPGRTTTTSSTSDPSTSTPPTTSAPSTSSSRPPTTTGPTRPTTSAPRPSSTPPSTLLASLPVTGWGGGLVWLAILILAIGVAIVLLARRRP